MNPEHLKTFLAVTRHRNFTRAAEERFLSQPAVSRQIQQLAEGLGTPLFEHVGRSLHLTDAGRTLLPLAEEILGSIERATEAVQSHREATRGRLRIGASSTPGIHLLPPLLGRFHRAYPDVELNYEVDDSAGIEQGLVRNALDLGFVGARPTHGSLRARRFADDEIVCFANPSHPLAARPTVETDDLRAQLWITRKPGSATRQLFEAWLTRNGASMTRSIELEAPEAIKALVVAGIGISFMSAAGLQRDLREGRVAQLAVSGLDLIRPIYLVRHADKHTSPVLDAFTHLVGGTC